MRKLGITVITIIVLGFLFLGVWEFMLGKVSSSKEIKEIIIEEGDTFASLGSKLKENNLIKSELFYKLYIKVKKPNSLKIGGYQLTENMGVKKIVKTISESEPSTSHLVIHVTFVEGKNMRYVAQMIADNTNNTIDQVYDLLKDEAYLDELITNYWFIDESIKNEKLYYPLEGYLFMDTYEFYKNTSVKEIFAKLLDQMANKLEPLKDKIEASKYSVHDLLTLASMVELEALSKDDRATVAGIFYNRLNDNWFLGSDVTTYYGLKEDNWDGLTYQELTECNSYNTRSTCFKGLPIGPIDNPSLSSIEAVLNPTNNDYYYFVADCDNKSYFSKTEYGHNQNIKNLQNQNKWCEN